ncbi:prepilin peptidase [Alkalicoccus luteus]|uniref:Prepilin leader peptidase/N-methyltransferase n=1 Tax=Alkalicoccus luteus TaxID=1237094 RepID=A0A969PSJ5_9BACI|nr:A24 family peptidase [Alkalicoccus luteus]NJP36754.1 prepilin peptidase [Alkalicoccus luteus]
MEMVLFVLIGLIIGSFLTAAGLRIPDGQSIVYPPSRCPACSRRLRPWNLVPVLSYLLQRGRCSGCGERISILYPSGELAFAILAAASFYIFGWSWELAAALLFSAMLVMISVSDLRFMLIPDRILLAFGIPLALLRLTAAPLDPWWDAAAGSAGGFALLFAAAAASRGGLGGGDVKLYAIVGLMLGFSGMLMSLAASSILGLSAGLAGVLIRKWGRETEIPFGPFIAAGALLVYFAGA